MAATGTRVIDTVVGAHRKTVTDVTMDSSYPTGGEPCAATLLGMGVAVVNASITMKDPGSTTVNLANFYYDATNEKIKCFDETPAEVANAADLTGVVLRVEAYGH